MQTARQYAAALARVATWRAQPLPYCVTIFSKAHDRSRPFGNKRFATPADALAWIARSKTPDAYFVDYAGTYEQAA